MKKLRAIVFAAFAALLMLALFAGCANGADGGEQAGEGTPAPAAPQAEVVSVSAAAVTVTEVEGAEYRLDDGAWQESNLFGGLTPRTDYVIRVRMAASGDTPAGSSTWLTARTLGKNTNKPPIRAEKVTGNSLILQSIAGAEWRIGDGQWQDAGEFRGLTPGETYTVSARYKATEGVEAGEPASAQFTCPLRDSVDVVLLAGQSNAVGFSHVSELSLPSYENVLFYGSGQMSELNALNADRWTTVRPGLGRDTSRFGPEIGIADALAEDYPADGTETLAIIKYAWGGTALWGLWTPPSAAAEGLGNANNFVTDSAGRQVGRYYEGMLRTFTEQLAALEGQGYDVNVLGFVWMQGETDAQNLPMARLYETMLTYLIGDVRTDLGREDLPAVIGRINTVVAGYEPMVIAAQESVCRNLPDCYFVDSSDLEMGLLDWWHFRASSMLELGRRFAGALTAAAGEKVPVSVEPVRLETGVGEAPSLPQYVSARTADGGLCLFPARFEIEPSDYAAVGSHTVGGYVLYGENYGLSFEAELTVKDGAKVDGSLGDAVWQAATVHEIALTADGTGLPPYYPAEAAFMVYAGEDGLYFAFDVKDAKLATNYNLTTAADWNLWQNDGIEVYIDASGGAAASLTEDSLTVRCTASDLLRVYAPNAAYSGWSVTNLYNSQAERVQGIRRELCIDGTPNQAYDADEGYTFELFVPYSVFGTDEISDYRIAAGVRSRANIPGGTETAFGAWSAAEQAAFTGVSPAQWVALADAL